MLLETRDGTHWSILSEIHRGDRNDGTEAIALPDGRLRAVARLEYDESWADGAFGDPRGSTLITESLPPYNRWVTTAESRVTRLDGPALFLYDNRVFALGRYQDGTSRLAPQGSCLARKRTALFEVRREELVRVTDLPSSGDTSYGGVLVEGKTAWLTYYSSRIDLDYPWILGMWLSTSVRLARINLEALAREARRLPAL